MTSEPNKNSEKKKLTALFTGKKAKWLPLFQRLLARFSRIPGVEMIPSSTAIAVGNAGDARPRVGVIRVTSKGLQVGLSLTKAALKSPRLKPCPKRPKHISHMVLVSDVSDIDEELLLWVKAASHQVRIAKRRSS